MMRLGSREVRRVLRALEGFEDTINSIQVEDMEIRQCCKAAGRSVEAWGVVMQELNDVVTALPNKPADSYDYGYRQAMAKALEIIARAMGGVLCES